MSSWRTVKTWPFGKPQKVSIYKDKVCFLKYVVSAQRIEIVDERIEKVENWLKPKFVCDIWVFLNFANFY